MGKNKIIILIILTVIGLAIGGVVYNKAVYTLEDAETTLSDLSVETIEKRVEILTDHIRIYNKQLETKGLDPEERFGIVQAITFAQNEIHKFQQELKRRRNTKR